MVNEDQVVDRRGVRYDDHEESGSGLSLCHPELAESFPVLFEICGRVVVDLVLLQEGVHLHSHFEAQQLPRLRGGKCVRPVCFERQALERRARQILPRGFDPGT